MGYVLVSNPTATEWRFGLEADALPDATAVVSGSMARELDTGRTLVSLGGAWVETEPGTMALLLALERIEALQTEVRDQSLAQTALLEQILEELATP